MARHRTPRRTAWYAASRLRHRIGRRGACLLVAAFVDITIGASLASAQGRLQARAVPVYRVLWAWLPPGGWALVWLAVGALCAVQAFARRDQWGYAGAIGVKAVWSVGAFAAWALYHTPRAWLVGLTWACLTGLVVVINGWPETPPSLRDAARRDQAGGDDPAGEQR